MTPSAEISTYEREKRENSLSIWGDAVVWEKLHKSTPYCSDWDSHPHVLSYNPVLFYAPHLKGKRAKKYRRDAEYGSACWGGPNDIAPFMDPVFENNVLLTKTERLMMSNRSKNPANARNKNVLIVSGSGSGKVLD